MVERQAVVEPRDSKERRFPIDYQSDESTTPVQKYLASDMARVARLLQSIKKAQMIEIRPNQLVKRGVIGVHTEINAACQSEVVPAD